MEKESFDVETVLDVPSSTALDPFSVIFTSICTWPSMGATLYETVAQMVATVTASSDLYTKLHEVVSAFLTAVITRPNSHYAWYTESLA